MKKLLVLALVLFMGFGSMTAVFGQTGAADEEFTKKMATAKTMTFEGTVLSHDVACHCFVVKTAKGEIVLQDDYVKFDQEYNKAKGLKIGAAVKGEYKKVSYINYATSVAYK
jgi:hypothetical protein